MFISHGPVLVFSGFQFTLDESFIYTQIFLIYLYKHRITWFGLLCLMQLFPEKTTDTSH